MPPRPPIPVLLAVPHAGRDYPPDLVARLRQPELATLRLEDRFVDLLAQNVAQETGVPLLVAHAPRAIIDLNRTPDDMDWEMVAGGRPANASRVAAGSRVRSGLGLIPRRLSSMGEIWRGRLTPEEVESRLEGVHRPYHAALAKGLEQLRDCWGGALLIDLHSMPPLGARGEGVVGPEFVIGDRFGASCAAHLSATALLHLAELGRPVAHNRPYAGGYVLERHGAPARGVHAMQIEVCRSAYLDAKLREPGPGLAATAKVLSSLIRRLAGELAGRGMAQAAE